MPARARYNSVKAICEMSTRSTSTHRDEEPLAESFFIDTCAERGPLEAAPGKTRIENEQLSIEKEPLRLFYILNFQFSIPT
jgi:hypothetical protein